MPDYTTSSAPRVSVVIPTHNRAALLPRAVDSVLAQTWEDFELIIVDDHFTDETPAVVAGLADGRIRSLRHECNTGQSRAFNTGTESARGEYIAFLDDDDEWLPHKLAAQVKLLDEAPSEVGLVYGWRNVLDDTDNRLVKNVRQTLRGDIFEQMLALDLPVPPSSWLVRRSVVRSVGGFDEEILAAKDVDFISRVCAQGWHVDFVPSVVLLKHRHTRGQLTDETRENLALRAEQVRAHLDRFARELRVRPAILARMHLRLARYELLHGSRRTVLSSVLTAFRLDPAGMIRRGLRHRRLALDMLVKVVRRLW